MYRIAGLLPAQHARFVCPPSQASKPIMALRRFLPLDTSMAQRGLHTDPMRSGPGRCCSRTMRQSLQVMASSRPTSTRSLPAPEKDQPAPTISLSDAPKIALPKNIAQTLQFLSDDDLETLRVSVDSELKRRRPTNSRPNARKASVTSLPENHDGRGFHPSASTQAMRNGRIAFQAIYGAPMFMGFDYMEIADGRQRLAIHFVVSLGHQTSPLPSRDVVASSNS